MTGKIQLADGESIGVLRMSNRKPVTPKILRAMLRAGRSLNTYEIAQLVGETCHTVYSCLRRLEQKRQVRKTKYRGKVRWSRIA